MVKGRWSAARRIRPLRAARSEERAGFEMEQTQRTEFEEMGPVLRQAKLGSYLVIPLKYQRGALRWPEIEALGRYYPITTADLTESVKELLQREHPTSVGTCWEIGRDALVEALFAGGELPVRFSVLDGRGDGAPVPFDFHTSYLYLFHTQVAFLCLGVTCSDIEALLRLRNPGFADDGWAGCRAAGGAGEEADFSLEEKLSALFARLGLAPFFGGGASPLLEAYTYLVAVTSQRFRQLDTIRQAAFNLHLMTPLDSASEDDSEEDVRYVYAVKTQALGSYRWGCCVSSQTACYVTANADGDLDGEMAAQAADGLPMILLALYEKYTCLRFTQLIAAADKRDMRQLRSLKRLMLEFRAYGTVDSANISRWHNVKQIYHAVMETNRIPEAVEDITNKLNILVEHQRELEDARNNTVAWVLTLFGIVSILASILSIIQILSGGDPLAWFATIMSTLVIAVLVAVVLIFRRKDE